jgi:outer membrane protein
MRLTVLAAALSVTPLIAAADSGIDLSFSAGLGGIVAPEYFGSDSYSAGVTGGFEFGHFNFGDIELGDPDPDAVRLGWQPRGSFRLVGARDASDFPELAGLNDIDLSIELGGGIGYRASAFSAFADIRYGVIGHEAWVSELGADAIFRPSDEMTITLGPRLLWGSEDYTATYFGVTAAEAGTSAFPQYSPGSGLVSAGLELGATYRFSPDWSLDGTVRWDRWTGDAADSPLVQSDDSVRFSIVLMRRFSFGF